MKSIKLNELKVTVMGLGLNGGGVQSALYFASHGARVTVTDLRDREVLAPSIELLKEYPIRYALGRHNEEDFAEADLVIKNPAVRENSPYLQAARRGGARIETDLSVFLAREINPLIAVTGSKGKSTTSSALHWCLKALYPGARLGGNITVSPLSFLDELTGKEPVVLELSSWQLGDLRGRGVLHPRVAIMTNILPDHQNAYTSMEDYVNDKRVIYESQTMEETLLVNYDDPVLKNEQGPGRTFYFSASPLPSGREGAWLEKDRGMMRLEGKEFLLFQGGPRLKGEHNRLNLLAAGAALVLFGCAPESFSAALLDFPGIEHRMELFASREGVDFINDSAATIPQATMAALKSLKGPVYLITGGTDKNIDFTPFKEVASLPREIYLLEGSGTEKLIPLLKELDVPFHGPYNGVRVPVEEAVKAASKGGTVILSPGCASFGLFLNEFDRGRKFKQAVLEILGQ